MCPHSAVDSKLAELENNINMWGLDRNITADGGATVMSQMSKMTEEFAEFLATYDKLMDVCCPGEIGNERLTGRNEKLHKELHDDFGDILVCLIHAMRLAGTDMETCLATAWADIKDRKGTMVNGKFVKEKPEYTPRVEVPDDPNAY